MCVHVSVCVCMCLFCLLVFATVFHNERGQQILVAFGTGEDFVNVALTYTSGEWSGYLVVDKVGFGDFSMDESNFALIISYFSTELGYWPLVIDH